jgi:hypothetical protein
MTVQRHERPHPRIERTFTAVRAALPTANTAAFDAELEAITQAPVVDSVRWAPGGPDPGPGAGPARGSFVGVHHPHGQ